MGVFSNYFMLESDGGLQNETLPEVDVDSLVDDDKVEAAWEESSYEAAMRCVAENTENFNNIIKACSIQELCFLEENGVEMVYTEASFADFKTAVVNFFKKVWEKIQSIFKKVIMQFASWSKNDKEFYNKYKKEITKAHTSGLKGYDEVEIKWFPYLYLTKNSADEIKGLIDASGKYSFAGTCDSPYAFLQKVGATEGVTGDNDADKEHWVAAAKKLVEDSDLVKSKINVYRGALCGKSNEEVEANEFSKEFAEYIQGGETEKETTELHKVVETALEFLSFSDKAKSELGKILKSNKKTIDDAIKVVEKLDKEFKKDQVKETEVNGKKTTTADANKVAGAKHNIATKLINAMKEEKNILIQYNGMALTHLKACSRQCKAACVKAATYLPKHESTDMFQTESDTSLLGSIHMI